MQTLSISDRPGRSASGGPAPLALTALVIGILTAAPIASVWLNLFAGGTGDTWAHLAATVLPSTSPTPSWLCLGVGGGVILVGVSTAWLVTMHAFPGRRFFEWALVLPLAVPAYVMAYAYTDLLQFVGPVQSWLRESFGWQQGGLLVPRRALCGRRRRHVQLRALSLRLSAGAHRLSRAGQRHAGGRPLARPGAWGSFFRISLPLARPAVAAGTALALMETLADYGTVAYFAVQTFTTGIYRAWFSLGDRIAAAQLSAALLGFVVLVLLLERASRGRARFHNTTGRNRPQPGQTLSGAAALAAMLACALPLLLGFLLPAGVLLRLALGDGDAQFGSAFLAAGRQQLQPGGADRAARGRPRRAAGLQRPVERRGLVTGAEPPRRPGLCRARLGHRRRRADSGDPPG
jgi:iron(III) transport system permease protein